jgi:hypothetical protein
MIIRKCEECHRVLLPYRRHMVDGRVFTRWPCSCKTSMIPLLYSDGGNDPFR